MPISPADLVRVGKSSLDAYMTSPVEDNIGTRHPFLDALLKKRKQFGGAKQNIVLSARARYGSNFAFTYGTSPVGFNTRDTLENPTWPWKVAVDGYFIPWDELFSNGIKVVESDDSKTRLEVSERAQLVQILDEQNEAFRLGFLEKLDEGLHRSGLASADSVTGLDGIVRLDSTSGVVAGIDSAVQPFWRNYSKTGISTATKGSVTRELELAMRACMTYGKSVPDLILMGDAFYDAYRDDLTITQNADAGTQKVIDGGVASLKFRGIECSWDPVFTNLDDLESPAVPWRKRCYFISLKHLQFRDDGIMNSSPYRPHNTRACYFMAQLRMALTSAKLNAHAVIAIA